MGHLDTTPVVCPGCGYHDLVPGPQGDWLCQCCGTTAIDEWRSAPEADQGP